MLARSRPCNAGIPLDEGLAELSGLRAMSTFETDKLVALMHPAPPPLQWYRATLAQGWKRQLRRMFGAVGAPIERLVRVRIGPVRIDGLRSGSVRPLEGSRDPRPRRWRRQQSPSRDGPAQTGPRKPAAS